MKDYVLIGVHDRDPYGPLLRFRVFFNRHACAAIKSPSSKQEADSWQFALVYAAVAGVDLAGDGSSRSS